MFLTKDEIMMG